MKNKYALILVLVLLITSCIPSKGSNFETTPIKVTLNNNLSYAPLLIAQAENYFQEYGLDVEFVTFDRSSEAVALLITGKVDVYAGTVNAGFLNTIYEEPNIKAVADRGHISPDDTCTYQAVLIRKDLFESGEVTKPEDMAGLEFASRDTGIQAYLLDTYLKDAGLSINDLVFNDLPDSVLVDAFQSETIDGSVVTEPLLSFVLNSGEAVILAESQNVVGSLQYGVIAFGPNILNDNPELGERFLAAYLKGVKQYNEGKTDRNLEIISEATGETIDNLKSGCWPAIREDGSVDFQAINGYQQWSLDKGEIDNLVSEEQFWDPRFIEKAFELIDQ
jgi:NitT/TauT family transport system substrate-binding protein